MGVWIMLAWDAIFGDPIKIPHPVVGIGRVITWWEMRWYGERHAAIRGACFLFSVVATTGVAAILVHFGIRKLMGLPMIIPK